MPILKTKLIKRTTNIYLVVYLGALSMTLAISACENQAKSNQKPYGVEHVTEYPPFITPVETYFDVRLGDIPSLTADAYQLKITGAIDNPVTLSVEDLRSLDQVERTVTIECIHNPVNVFLVGTATWKGFEVYKLLKTLGIKDGATVVKYHCADGYYSYNTIEELETEEVIGALYMNGEPIPPKYGFPLRLIFPGYYGVRQPGWIVEMEIMDTEYKDYFDLYRTDSAIAVDSRIFFPVSNEQFSPGETIRFGGAAYGGRRISSVEISGDDGNTWIPAAISDSLNQDHAWVFWEVDYVPQSTGRVTIYARATSDDGRVQPREDDNIYDGINAWPSVTITVEDGN